MVDPTRTKTIRTRYERDIVSRLKRVIADTIASIVVNDAFGFDLVRLQNERRFRLRGFSQAVRNEWFVPGNQAESLARFNRFISEQISEGVLQVTDREGAVITGRIRWQDAYIESAYKRGIIQAHTTLSAFGAATSTGNAVLALGAPIHAGTVKILFERQFSLLQGITAQMEASIQRVVAQGLVDGRGASVIARQIRDATDVSIQRARVLARTEVINAHATATLNELEREGIEEVQADVEFTTAGDGRVCVQCQSLEGRVFTIKEARGVIPVHPQCRCSWRPANIGENRAQARREASATRQRITRRRKVLAEAA